MFFEINSGYPIKLGAIQQLPCRCCADRGQSRPEIRDPFLWLGEIRAPSAAHQSAFPRSSQILPQQFSNSKLR
jgi:hypothetical protein